MVINSREKMRYFLTSKYRDHNEELSQLISDQIKNNGLKIKTVDKNIFFSKESNSYKLRTYVLKQSSLISLKEGDFYTIKILDTKKQRCLCEKTESFIASNLMSFKSSLIENKGEPIDIIFYCDSKKENSSEKVGDMLLSDVKKLLNYNMEYSSSKNNWTLFNNWKLFGFTIDPITSPSKYQEEIKNYKIKPKNNSILYLSILKKNLNNNFSHICKRVLIKRHYKKTLKLINQLKIHLYHHLDNKIPLPVDWNYTIYHQRNSEELKLNLFQNELKSRTQFSSNSCSVRPERFLLTIIDLFFIKPIHFFILTFKLLRKRYNEKV